MSLKTALFFLLYLYAYASCGEDFKPNRFHLVDYIEFANGGTNWMFRGNAPVINDTFCFETLVAYMNMRASEANLQFPDAFYFIDISLLNPLNIPAFEIEVAFWKSIPANDSSTFGELLNWYPSGIQAVIPPNELSTLEQREYCSNAYIWEIDDMPVRINRTFELFSQQRSDNLPVSVYVHCEAGCDRTGEFIADYRLMYQAQLINGSNIAHNISYDYDLDCAECGRCPNYWSTTAIQWFCLCHQFGTLSPKLDFGDCLSFANCTYAGDCHQNP